MRRTAKRLSKRLGSSAKKKKKSRESKKQLPLRKPKLVKNKRSLKWSRSSS